VIDALRRLLFRYPDLDQRGTGGSDRNSFPTGSLLYGEPTMLAKRKDLHARTFIACCPRLMPTAGRMPRHLGIHPASCLSKTRTPCSCQTDRATIGSIASATSWSTRRSGCSSWYSANYNSLWVNGTARLLTDDVLRERFSVNDKPARAVLKVMPTQVFFHCGKSPIRSRIWEPAHWPDRAGLPILGVAPADQIKRSKPLLSRPCWLRALRSVSTSGESTGYFMWHMPDAFSFPHARRR
jgi:hypothetical protein